jgi:hypothetical protein
MWCVCQHNESGELTIMSRHERETMLSVLIGLGEPIPTWVIMVKHTKEDAEQYATNIRNVNELLAELNKTTQ